MKSPISPELLQPEVWQHGSQQKKNVMSTAIVYCYTVRASDRQFVRSDKQTFESLEGKLTSIKSSTSRFEDKPIWIITLTDSNNTIHSIEVNQRGLPALTYINALLGMIDRGEPITSSCYYFIKSITIEKPGAKDKNFGKLGISTDGTQQISGRMTNEEILEIFDLNNALPRLTFLHDAVQTIIKHL